MKSVIALLFAAAMLIPSSARAQSPAPIGTWQGLHSGDYLIIEGNGNCAARGTVNVAGTCRWAPTAIGGILTMTYPWTIAPGHIVWSIRWINQSTILVNNVEQFVRRG